MVISGIRCVIMTEHYNLNHSLPREIMYNEFHYNDIMTAYSVHYTTLALLIMNMYILIDSIMSRSREWLHMIMTNILSLNKH